MLRAPPSGKAKVKQNLY